MKYFIPDYYDKFKCISDKCRHNCCIGWEIDIDNDTYEYYKKAEGTMGKRIIEKISVDNEIPHFILSENERCPFLNENNLCEIILESGEKNLCQICTDHPRFRNFSENRIETGLGLCCEEAGRIILTNKNKFRLISAENDDYKESEEEYIFFSKRQKLFDIIQNDAVPLDKRTEEFLSEFNLSLPENSPLQWAEFFMKLERLDSEWTKRLESIKHGTKELSDKTWDKAFENLIIYFIYRHMSQPDEEYRLPEKAVFVIVSYKMIKDIFSVSENQNIDELIEIARLYSSEIEYSDENIEIILEYLEQKLYFNANTTV